MATYIRPISTTLLTTGLVGTLGYKVLAADNSTVLVARTVAGVSEDGSSAQYSASVANWDTDWSGFIVWDAGAGTLTKEAFLSTTVSSGGGGGGGIAGIHYVTTMIVPVSKSTGKVLFKDDATNRIGDYLNTVSEHRVVADPAVASSAANPTVKLYLELEAALGYKLQYMDQNKIVTYLAS